MVAIQSDNKAVQNALEKLAALITAEGGTLSDRLTIRSKDGNISLHSDLPAESRDCLVTVPEKCFLPLTGVKFELSGDTLKVSSGADGLSKARQDILAVTVDIYNLTDKIAKYRTSSPRIVFRDDRETIGQLVAGRPDTGVVKGFFDILKADDVDDLVIEYFFRTRNFAFNGEKRQVIPVIDFANHNSLAPPFKREHEGSKVTSMSLLNVKLSPTSDECQARYGLWDAYDTYLMFGFSNAPVLFVRSVPVNIRLNTIGTIKIGSRIASAGGAKGLKPNPVNIAYLNPGRVTLQGNDLLVSNLMIPNPQAPLALKRVLAELVTRIGPGLGVNAELGAFAHPALGIASRTTRIVNDNYSTMLKNSCRWPRASVLRIEK